MDTFRIDLLGFAPCDEAELQGRIALSFGIDAESSRQLIESAPTVIKQNLNEDDTMAFVGALVQCGGQVRVVHEASGEATLYGIDDSTSSEQVAGGESDDLLGLIAEEVSGEAPTWLTSVADSTAPAPSSPPAQGLGGFGEASARSSPPGEIFIPPPPSATGKPAQSRPKTGRDKPSKRSTSFKPDKKSGKRSPARWIAAVLIVVATGLLIFFLTADQLDLEDVPPEDVPEGFGPEFQLIRD